LKWKYASEGIEDPDVKIVFVTQPGDNAQHLSQKQDRPIKFSGKIAEEVGFDKIRKQLSQLSELKIIILDGLRICRPEDRMKPMQEAPEADSMTLQNNDDIRNACPKATELDLSRNLLEEWREVLGICRQLDNLISLRIE
jgi:tubulin-specific chaperone E